MRNFHRTLILSFFTIVQAYTIYSQLKHVWTNITFFYLFRSISAVIKFSFDYDPAIKFSSSLEIKILKKILLVNLINLDIFSLFIYLCLQMKIHLNTRGNEWSDSNEVVWWNISADSVFFFVNTWNAYHMDGHESSFLCPLNI